MKIDVDCGVGVGAGGFKCVEVVTGGRTQKRDVFIVLVVQRSMGVQSIGISTCSMLLEILLLLLLRKPLVVVEV